ncbi:multidrug efflux pump subunit AcrB [Microbacterium testaceum]|uniref:efflux RND transporter permease subunit n=1 Tax=Microbacterium TaxID=33882 RepID=UPI00278B0E73|nr:MULTISPECIES: efflux RND transporter permease subunit [Microbacterium]MDQ1111032.1 multidrug efflux pump subunit AcrB [Microbacterium testaceum]MDR6098430.1 multidrug efflux pump subunit AcrB [Microbacterium sp. SORGH_AS_0454]
MSSLTRLSLANRLLVVLVSIFIVAAGLIAASGLRQELLPSLQPPTASVVATYAGASSASVEKEVTVPLEDAVKAVPGVDRVTSTTGGGVSRVSVEWPYGLDAEKVVQDLRSAVGAAQAALPRDVVTEVYAGSTDDLPAVQVAVTSAGDAALLGDEVQRVLVPALRAVDGVREVTVTGVEEERLVVTMRPSDATAKDVTASQVQDVLAASLSVTAAGTSREGDTALAVEVGSVPTSTDQVAALVIPGENGPVSVGEVADVALESAPETSLARVDGVPAVTISVTKTPQAGVVEVSHEVARVLDDRRDALGSDVAFTTIFDQAPYIEQSIHDLSTEGALGLAFAIGVILLFLLSVRATIITAISIPLSLLIAMIGLAVGGFSLSILTLAALTIAVGRVVDDSIVVIENIARHRETGVSTDPGIVQAVREVAGAITASTLTTVAVFAPIAFVPGITGELFRPFAVTVTIALLASLLVSLTVVPVLASWVMRRPPRPLSPERFAALQRRRREREDREAERRRQVVERENERRRRRGVPGIVAGQGTEPLDRLQAAYVPLLHLALRRPAGTLAVAVVVFVLTVVASGALRESFLDDDGQRTVSVTQAMPPGLFLPAASERAAQIEEILDADDDVATALTTVTEESATHTVILNDDADPQIAVARLRAELSSVQGVGQIAVHGTSSTGNSDLTVTVSGASEKSLAAGAEQVRAALAELRDLDGLRSDAVADEPILAVSVDQLRAAQYGFTQAEVGRAIHDGLRGARVGTVELDGHRHEVVLRGQANDATPAQIAGFELPVSALQQATAQKRASDALVVAQNAEQAAAEARQDESLSDQLAETRSARSSAQTQLADLVVQLNTLLTASPPPASTTPPADPAPDPAAAAQQAAAAQASVDALADSLGEAQRHEQIAQLQQSIAQVRASIAQLGTQIDGLIETRDETVAQRARAAALADQQKALADVRATPIEVGDIATVATSTGPSSITRTDGMRAITLTATPTGGDPGGVLLNVEAALGLVELPDGVTVSLGGGATEQDASLTHLALAMLAAIGIVFLIMAATFRSLAQSLILLVSIPFAATGAIALMLATDTPLGIPAMIGMLMLIGIVVTNAIVLVDLVNGRRAAGHDLLSAVIDGARLRLRPILMTAAATVLALVPMALGFTGGGVFVSRALAIVVIGGLISSTLLTLVLVPVLYLLVERRKERRAQQRRAREGSTAPAADGA